MEKSKIKVGDTVNVPSRMGGSFNCILISHDEITNVWEAKVTDKNDWFGKKLYFLPNEIIKKVS